MDDNISYNVLTFVQDINVFRKVSNDGDEQHLQNDLDNLEVIQGHGNLDVNNKLVDKQ